MNKLLILTLLLLPSIAKAERWRGLIVSTIAVETERVPELLPELIVPELIVPELIVPELVPEIQYKRVCENGVCVLVPAPIPDSILPEPFPSVEKPVQTSTTTAKQRTLYKRPFQRIFRRRSFFYR